MDVVLPEAMPLGLLWLAFDKYEDDWERSAISKLRHREEGVVTAVFF